VGGCLRVWLGEGRVARRGGWLEEGGRDGGVTYVTEVVVLNCDCEELGFHVCEVLPE